MARAAARALFAATAVELTMTSLAGRYCFDVYSSDEARCGSVDVVVGDAEKCIGCVGARGFEAPASIRYQLFLRSHRTATSTVMPSSNHPRLLSSVATPTHSHRRLMQIV